MFIFISRILKFAWQNFWRNLGLSLITILILVTTLISVDIVFLVRGITNTAVKLVEKRIDISLIFKPSAAEEKIQEIKKVLEQNPEVSSLTYKDKETVLNEFKTKHQGDEGVMSALAELDENPLGALLVVQAKNTNDYEAIIKSLDTTEFNDLIEEKTFDDHGPIIQKIGLITSKTQQVGIILGAILTIVAFLIIFNVIRLSIIMHGEEIGIMKLVGATNSFVRWPYLVEMFFISLLAWGINLALVYGAIYFVDPYLAKFFEGSGFALRSFFDQNFLIFFGSELVGLIVLSFVSAGLAMRRYLKV
ncbi:MAG TPA: permease-like cell division protein FtsX [Candidatus Magasanikbacteria bacterium]|nr:permease-like cell division protein FtsX [Candidatus Magasanikbacteria bacterium]